MPILPLTLGLTLGLPLALVLATQDQKSTRGDQLVKVELHADRAAVRPGETFAIAVKLTVEPGWHIYWENPGDSGLTTKLGLRGPEGFEIGEPRFPAPEREVAEGDIVTYVHKGEVYFLAEVRAPLDLKKALGGGSALAFDVDASWLACIEACYPGSGKAHLEIPVSPSAEPQPANEKPFAAARARLPRPWIELENAEIEWLGTGERRVVRMSVLDATGLEFFPFKSEATSLEGRKVESSGRTFRLSADLRLGDASSPAPPRLKGVLVVKTEKGESSFLVDSTEPLADK